MMVVAVVGCALIVAKHHQNIRRLIKGTENRIGGRVGSATGGFVA
jgi:glycerol-3-phosphate acyltransferase PlsY